MVTKGDKMVVQTPDFLEFANDVQGITSRNELIYKAKRMMMMRGTRTNLQIVNTNGLKGM